MVQAGDEIGEGGGEGSPIRRQIVDGRAAGERVGDVGVDAVRAGIGAGVAAIAVDAGRASSREPVAVTKAMRRGGMAGRGARGRRRIGGWKAAALLACIHPTAAAATKGE